MAVGHRCGNSRQLCRGTPLGRRAGRRSRPAGADGEPAALVRTEGLFGGARLLGVAHGAGRVAEHAVRTRVGSDRMLDRDGGCRSTAVISSRRAHHRMGRALRRARLGIEPGAADGQDDLDADLRAVRRRMGDDRVRGVLPADRRQARSESHVAGAGVRAQCHSRLRAVRVRRDWAVSGDGAGKAVCGLRDRVSGHCRGRAPVDEDGLAPVRRPVYPDDLDAFCTFRIDVSGSFASDSTAPADLSDACTSTPRPSYASAANTRRIP